MKILIVEDEPSLSDVLRQSLSEAGYVTAEAPTFRGGEEAWSGFEPNLVVLDLMLPDGDGMDLLRNARGRGDQTPVLILSAKNALPDRVAGLDSGADDYLAKPFPLEELLARVRALLRRASTEPFVYRLDDLEIDSVHRRVKRAGRLVYLSATEFSILELLAQRAGEAVSKTEILRQIWDDESRDANLVEVYVNYLRQKLERGGASRLIRTVRGQGYSLQAGAHAEA